MIRNLKSLIRRYFEKDTKKPNAELPLNTLKNNIAKSKNAKIEMEESARINGDCTVRGNGTLRIGKHAAIGDQLRVILSNHNISRANTQGLFCLKHGFESVISEEGIVTIGAATWIGDSVILLPESKIPVGCCVGAGSVVTKKEFPPYSIIAGNPAKTIRSRFPEETIKVLIDSEWWNWNENKIKRNHRFFNADLTKIGPQDLLREIVE